MTKKDNWYYDCINFEKDAVNLTFFQPWMTVSDARILFSDAFERFQSYKKYHGWKNVWTLMNISYGIWQRESETNLRARLDLIKSRMDCNSTGRDTPTEI
tara:strand:- start:197 stop:496 length:300 start_codon:yes stop_codon:yes gene_type:complete